MQRRKFLYESGLIAGGFFLHKNLFAENLTDTYNRPLQVGVIGCGDRGKGLISVMGELKDLFKVVAICDTLDFRIQEAMTSKLDPSVKTYKDFRGLIDDKNVQAVVIATPLYLHYPMAVATLDAGKHLFLEKTMTFTSDEALSLHKKSKQHANLVLQVGHQYRYTPLYLRVKEMISKNYLGDVTQIDCRWDRNHNWRRSVPDPSLERLINWRMYREYSGGLVAELLSHQIDFINWAFDTHPDRITATGGIDHFNDGRETFDNVQAVLRYDKNGMIGNFGATCANAREGYIFKIKGNKGSVHLLVNEGTYFPEPETRKQLETVDGVTGATKIEWNKDGGIPIMKEKPKDGTWYALKEFYDAVHQKKQPLSNVSTGATTALCVHLANISLYNRTIEHWKPEYNSVNS
jgi:predicted dehydrogenase